MNLVPVLTRELELAVRRPATYSSRSVAALVVTIASLGLLYAGMGGLMKPLSAGRNLFFILSLLGYSYVLLEGVLRTADSISEEKREGTIGLLFLTDLNSMGLVLGKVVARVLPAACTLVAALPALALSMFLGGVAGVEFFRMILALLNALFFASAFGVLVSACCRSDRMAIGLGLFGIAIFGVALPEFGHLIQQAKLLAAVPARFLAFSPGGPVWDLLNIGKDLTAPSNPGKFALYLFVSHMVAWAFLLLASAMLSWTWREPAGGRFQPWRWFFARTKLWKNRERGHYRVLRRRWYDDQPIVWIGERHGFEQFAWGTFIAIGLVLMGVLWFDRSLIANWPVVIVCALVLHLFLVVGAVIHTCRGPAEDRRTGVMELLTTTPVGPDMIIQGRMLTFKRQAIRPLVFVLLLDAAISATAWWRLEWAEAAGIALLLLVFAAKSLADLYVVSWVGFWQGLKAGNTTAAVHRTVACVFLWRWLGLLSLAAVLGLLTGGSAFRSQSTVVLLGAGYFVLLLMSHWHFCALAQSELKDDLRMLAARQEDEADLAPVSATGRFRSWWSDWFSFLLPARTKNNARAWFFVI